MKTHDLMGRHLRWLGVVGGAPRSALRARPHDLERRPGRRRGPRPGRRGLTLLEAVFAALILAVGVLSIFALMNRVDVANRSVAFQRTSLDLLARFSAEVRDSRCEWVDGTGINPARTDPGILRAVDDGTWVLVRDLGSVIETVGDFETVPPLQVSYRVALDATGEPALDFDVRIRQRMGDPIMDAPELESAYWIQTFPVKKLCNSRPGADAPRGEY